MHLLHSSIMKSIQITSTPTTNVLSYGLTPLFSKSIADAMALPFIYILYLLAA